ncbi:NTP transferase domain-containing protein [Candidatus Uhrbacteria bacterium]|nr:NTP transferase domain-containing protein [Candidatus Uhrbacteria bacterium]
MNFRFIILAAGKGKRMHSDIPKALTTVCGKPILQYVHESVMRTRLDSSPIVVIGPERIPLCESFNGACKYVVQEEQLGTAHAVQMARKEVGEQTESVIVLYGDHPFVSTQTLQRLVALHEQKQVVVTMMTTTVPSFDDWHRAYLYWGRILRDADNNIVGIREYKDATNQEREIREVNPALYCFDTKWLWEQIGEIKNVNANQEFYLTDLVELAVAQGYKIYSLSIPPEEAVGINTPEEREIAEKILRNRKSEIINPES